MHEREMEAVPAGFGRVGAFGVVLAAPVEWNPVVLHARKGGGVKQRMGLGGEPAATGVIALADLRGSRLEVRWRTMGEGRAARALEASTRKLVKAGATVRREWGAVCVAGEKGWDVLAAVGGRLYEVHVPGGESAEARVAVEWFLRVNRAPSGGTQARADRYWCLYGAEGWAPREAVVRSMSLQPGRVEVVLAYRGGRTTLGSAGLADRALAEAGSLIGWAKDMAGVKGVMGQWAGGEGEEVSFQGVYWRKLCRRVRHAVRVRHDRAGNRIVWEHVERWGTKQA